MKGKGGVRHLEVVDEAPGRRDDDLHAVAEVADLFHGAIDRNAHDEEDTVRQGEARNNGHGDGDGTEGDARNTKRLRACVTCVDLGTPPYTHVFLISLDAPNLSHSCLICTASSRVGASTSTMGPSPGWR